MPPLTRILARHVAGLRRDQLPEPALRAAARSLLDVLGVSLAASGLEPACAPFAELAAESSGPCQLLGFGHRASPLMAALANGALAHALDYEDAYDGTPAHPSAASVPVALALAEAHAQLDGTRLLLALAAGCDVSCRLARALEANPDDFGFYTPPLLGAFGAAVTAARLLELDEERCVACLGLTLTQTMCSSQLKRDPESPLRAVRDAFAAQAGLLAASLAARGVRSFEAALEGEHGFYALFARGAYRAEGVLDDLGRHFLGADVSYKPWPSCRGTHAFVEAALQLRAASDQGDIVEITAHGAELNRMLAEPAAQKARPVTAIDAKFSIPFCVATALVRGGLALSDFSEAARGEPRVLELARRVRFLPEPGAGMREATSGRLVLHMRGGRRLEARIAQPLGHPDRPLTDSALQAKFVDCATRARRPLSAAAAHSVAHAVLALDGAASARETLARLVVQD